MGVAVGVHVCGGAPAEGASEPADRAAMLRTVTRPSHPAALSLARLRFRTRATCPHPPHTVLLAAREVGVAQ